MNPEIYYHILEIGVIFEKGGKQGNRWHWGEKKRLLDDMPKALHGDDELGR